MFKIGQFITLLMVSMFARPSINYAPKITGGLTAKDAASLRKTAWDKNLREDNTLADIWTKMAVTVDIRNNNIEIPNSIFMQFMTPPKGTHSLVVGMSLPYQEAFQEGDLEPMLGNEEDTRLLSLALRYNEIKKAVGFRGWGINFNDLEATGIYDQINPKFNKVWQEYRGVRIRTASMLTYENALTKSPVSLKQQFCSNVFIPNLAPGDMPTWDISDLTNTAGVQDSLGFYNARSFSGASTYVESLGTKMLQASGTASASKAYMSVENLEDLYLYVKNTVRSNPIKIGKNSGYIFVVPENVSSYLTNPNRAGSMGELWTKTAHLSTEEQSFTGMLGKYKDLWFVVDSRSPTLTISGSSGSYVLRPGFMNPGNNDDRNQTMWSATSGSLNYVFDVGFVYGEGGLAEWVANPLAYANESTEFGQHLAKGSYMCSGIQTARFDVDTPDDANNSASTGLGSQLVQRGVVMVLMSRIPTYTLR